MDRILYGKNDPSLFASGTIADATPFLEFDWSFFDSSYRVKTRLVGEFNFDNAIAAVAVSKFFGINAERISSSLEDYEPTNYRSQFMRTTKNDLIIDTYNANPTSMKTSLDFFISIPTTLPKMAILGEMKELGEVSENEHKRMISYLLDNSDLEIYLVGQVFTNLIIPDSKFKFFESVIELNLFLKKSQITGYYIFIKGSNSVQLDKVIEFL